MRLDAERTAPAPEVDALRRRLYEPDAGDEDVARYRAIEHAEAPGLEPADAPIRGRRRRAAGAAAVLAVLGVAAVGLWLGARTPVRAPVLSPSIAPAPATQTLADYEALAVPPAVRAAFVAEVRRGRPIGLQQYFTDHPAQQPRQVLSGLREDSVEQAGAGSAVLDLPVSGTATNGGELTLVLTVDRAATVRWTLVAPGDRDDSAWYALEDVQGQPGLPAVASLPYAPLRPRSVAITLPAGVHWDLMTIFTD